MQVHFIKMSKEFFIWPEAHLPRKSSLFKKVSHATIEDRLTEMFYLKGFPVLVSSARTGIAIALEESGVRRSDLVGLFPYASHCVIEAVGRVGTPTAALNKTKYKIIYHQWGYVQEKKVDGVLIEDAVDTFCLNSVDLFPAGGDFELWSLPKLVGCIGGGILWCKNESVADSIRRNRDMKKNGTNFRWALRLLSHYFPSINPLWSGAESLGGGVPNWACGDIMASLLKWEEIAVSRQRRLEMMLPLMSSWLQLEHGRIPSVIPVQVNDKQAKSLASLGLIAGFRHIECIDKSGFKFMRKVVPIPIHQEIPLDLLRRAIKIIEAN